MADQVPASTAPKSLPRLALPLMVSFTLRFLFTMVDVVYAAILNDEVAVAAIGLFIPVSSVFIAIWVGLSAGFTASLSAAFGLRDEVRVRALKRAMLKIQVALIPTLLALAGLLNLGIPMLGLPDDLARAFRLYATVLVVGMPFSGFWSIYPDSIVKAHHDTTTTMVAGISSTAANLALNTLFVFGFGWGLFGIALATVLSRLAGLSYATARMRVLEARRRQPGWDLGAREAPPPLRSILRLAVPGALTYLLMGLEDTVIAKLLIGLEDATTAIASYTVYNRALSLSIMPAVATSVAVLPFVARLLPEGLLERVRADLHRTLLLVMGVALVITVPAGLVFAEPVAAFLVPGGPEGSPMPPAQAISALSLLPLAALALIPFQMLRPVFEATFNPRRGILVSVLRYAVFSLPLVLTGRYLGPMVGVSDFIGLICGMIAAGALASLVTLRWSARVLSGPGAGGR